MRNTMSDLDIIKNFVIKISRTLDGKELSKFGSQIFSFCYEKDIPIPPGLHNDSNFLEFMDFAFKQSLITPTDTYLISQLLFETERYELNEELFYLEKTFTKVERRPRTHTDPYALTSSGKSYSTPIPIYKTTTKIQKNYKTSSKSDVMKLFSKLKIASKTVSHRKVSDSQDTREWNNNMLTDIQVMSYCSQIGPDEWKKLAIIGFRLTISQVDRIDYDCRALQDKTISTFGVWKNLSLGSPYYPPYTEQGLMQSLVEANLNGLIYRLFLD